MATKNDILIKFGKQVQKIRLKKGFHSQMALAHKTGLDRTYIGGVERGERNIGLKNIEKIAKALEVSLDELFQL